MCECKTFVKVSRDAIDLQEAERFVLDDACGAIASFVGVTRRDIVDDRTVIGLEFEAHVPLAEAVLHDIVSSYRKRSESDLKHVYIHHRLGFVPVGSGNLVLAVSSPHRKTAFRAVEALMEELKSTLPVWKKEKFHDNSYRWSQNVEFTPS